MSGFFRIAPAVAEALAAGRPVVALETTLVTHGLPRPEGLAVATELERIVAAGGATPATIGILDGTIVVGLDPAELARLAAATGVVKVNPGNLGATLAAKRDGSTTVAATVLAAHRAGIRVMATGGIGGVHRGAEATGDVSADLMALCRHPVAVVCAGAKAVLDLPRTREMLETLGVPVLGVGTGEFPAFYRRSSGLSVDHRCAGAADVAATLAAHFALAPTGVVVANPVPAEHEMAAETCAAAIDRALAEAEAAAVRGRDVTPFLLDRIRTLTGGASVAVNRALLVANAALAADVAAALATQPNMRSQGDRTT